MFYRIQIIIIISALIIASCAGENNHRSAVKDAGAGVEPDQVSYNVKVTFVDSTVAKAKLKADRARIYAAALKTYLDGHMSVEFLSEYTGERVSLLTADSAEIDDKTKDMLARGNVIIVSDSTNTKVETSLLMWNNKLRQFYSTEFVKITSPEEYIQGYGFESDENLKNYKIFKVSGEKK